MPIPAKRFPIDLKSADPTELTPKALQKQLHNIGLTCEHTKKKALEKFISDVEEDIPQGVIETYQILKPGSGDSGELGGLEEEWSESSIGNWLPSSTGIGYAADLEYIVYPQHFDWLEKNAQTIGFTGKHTSQHFSERYDSVDAIKDMFINLALTTSSSVIKGLNKASIESVFSNAISPLNESGAKDYDKRESRVIFLVDNYNEEEGTAEAIGVISVDWHLVIQDYKVKKEAAKHNTELDVYVRVVLYSDLGELNKQIKMAKAHFKGNSFDGRGYSVGDIPVKDTSVKIYDKRPNPDRITFRHSLPIMADNKKAQVIVLYSPDLQNIGSIDNTRSAATSTYNKSVTTGFTFSSTQKIDIGAEFEAGVVLVKGKVSVNLSVSFTESSSKATTETIGFSVPPGKLAFTYQGTLRSQILEYDPENDVYEYKAGSRFLSPVMATTNEPIVSNAKAEIVATI